MRSPVETRAERSFGQQLGLCTTAQLARMGVDRGTVDTRRRQGRWELVAPGLYRIVGAPITWEQRALAACLVAGDGAVVSHGAAGAALGLGDLRRGPIEVTVPRGRAAARARRLAVVHRSRRLDRVDTARVGVLPATTPARTVIDLAGRVHVAVLAQLVDEVLCRRMTTLSHLEDRVSVLLGQGRAGTGALQQVLEAWTPGPPADSGAEMALVRLLVERGLPAPVRQYPVVHQGRFVGRVDLAWPEYRVAAELDSERWHGGGRPFHRDKARGLRLAAAGWQVMPVTPLNLETGSLDDLVSALWAGLEERGGPSRPRRPGRPCPGRAPALSRRGRP